MQLILAVAVAMATFAPAAPAAALAAPPAAVRPWWEAYDEALRAIDQSNWSGALAALEEAVKGNAKSGDRARTYGMRFIAYFPYYYMGVSHFKLGNTEQALEYLRKEEAQGAATKVAAIKRELEFYILASNAVLDEAKVAAVLADSIVSKPAVVVGTPVPKPLPTLDSIAKPEPAVQPDPNADPPNLIILTPRESTEPIKEQTVRVQGNIIDKYGVAIVSLEINGVPSDLLEVGSGTGGTASADAPSADGVQQLGRLVHFKADIPLEPGTTTIIVRVANIKGQMKDATREVRRNK